MFRLIFFTSVKIFSVRIAVAQAGQVIAAATDERVQTRKVRASQGRMPDNVRWR